MPHHSSQASSSKKSAGIAITGSGIMAPSGLREKATDKVGSLFGKSQAGSKFDAPYSTRGDHAKHSSSHHHGSSSRHHGSSSHHRGSSSHHPGQSTHHSHHPSRPSLDQRTLTSHARPSMAMVPFDGPMESRRPSMSTIMNGPMSGPRRAHSHFPSSTHSHMPSSSLRQSAYGPSSAISRYPLQMAASRGPARTVEYEVEYSMKVTYYER
jgi:hypothetical protein